MNKSFITKVLIMSTVLMAGIILIPTNIQDARANPCSDITAMELVETVELVEIVGLLETGGNGGSQGITYGW